MARPKITLTTGATILAPILHQDDKRVIVDLGSSTVTIASEDIAQIDHTEANSASAPTNQGEIYSTARLKPTTIDQLIAEYSDAIVMVSTPAGLGTGFLINERGHFLTNYHVIEGETAISVTVFVRDGDQYQRQELKKVKIIATQPGRDLALLQLDLEELDDLKLPHVVFADEEVQPTTR